MNEYLQFPSILLAVGFCNSGKTVSIRYTIKTCNCWDFIIVISNTAQFNGDYDFLKEKGIKHRIYGASDIGGIIEKVLKIQADNIKKGIKQNVLLVLDDIMGSLNTCDAFKKLTSTYRHMMLSLFITTQFCNNSTTYVRELANYVYCFDQRTEQSKKAIYSSYFSDVGTLAEFKKLFSGLKPFQFFFIDRIKKRRFKFICPFDGPKKEELPPPTKIAEVDEKKEFIKKYDSI